ncbi:ABC transporter A like protein [Aduncisulcus paluster]|uniref:ABC transporter A like protein n=1 Tax=Aduncisulcus paluster TaxID=2918883 RepID=A0ABQ5JUX3_9EUKA|nr:ABC transporter A like protein [Aduncisulcus paluster]
MGQFKGLFYKNYLVLKTQKINSLCLILFPSIIFSLLYLTISLVFLKSIPGDVTGIALDPAPKCQVYTEEGLVIPDHPCITLAYAPKDDPLATQLAHGVAKLNGWDISEVVGFDTEADIVSYAFRTQFPNEKELWPLGLAIGENIPDFFFDEVELSVSDFSDDSSDVNDLYRAKLASLLTFSQKLGAKSSASLPQSEKLTTVDAPIDKDPFIDNFEEAPTASFGNSFISQADIPIFYALTLNTNDEHFLLRDSDSGESLPPNSYPTALGFPSTFQYHMFFNTTDIDHGWFVREDPLAQYADDNMFTTQRALQMQMAVHDVITRMIGGIGNAGRTDTMGSEVDENDSTSSGFSLPLTHSPTFARLPEISQAQAVKEEEFVNITLLACSAVWFILAVSMPLRERTSKRGVSLRLLGANETINTIVWIISLSFLAGLSIPSISNTPFVTYDNTALPLPRAFEWIHPAFAFFAPVGSVSSLCNPDIQAMLEQYEAGNVLTNSGKIGKNDDNIFNSNSKLNTDFDQSDIDSESRTNFKRFSAAFSFDEESYDSQNNNIQSDDDSSSITYVTSLYFETSCIWTDTECYDYHHIEMPCIGVDIDDIGTCWYNVPLFGLGIVEMFVQTIMYSILAIYFINVIPVDGLVTYPAWFIFDKRFWEFIRSQNRKDENVDIDNTNTNFTLNEGIDIHDDQSSRESSSSPRHASLQSISPGILSFEALEFFRKLKDVIASNNGGTESIASFQQQSGSLLLDKGEESIGPDGEESDHFKILQRCDNLEDLDVNTEEYREGKKVFLEKCDKRLVPLLSSIPSWPFVHINQEREVGSTTSVPVLSCHDVSKTYSTHSCSSKCKKDNNKNNENNGVVSALKHLSLALFPSRITSLCGNSGSGKTTAVRVLTGEEMCDVRQGAHVILYGTSVSENPYHARKVKTQVGVGPQTNEYVWPNVTVREHLQFVWLLKGFPGFKNTHNRCFISKENALYREDGELFDIFEGIPFSVLVDVFSFSLLRSFHLLHKLHIHANNLSGGEQRRVCGSMACSCVSPLIVLDEVGTGLDFMTRRTLTRTLKRHANAGCSVLFTSHDLDDVERMSDEVIILRDGSTIARGNPKSIQLCELDGHYFPSHSIPSLPSIESSSSLSSHIIQRVDDNEHASSSHGNTDIDISDSDSGNLILKQGSTYLEHGMIVMIRIPSSSTIAGHECSMSLNEFMSYVLLDKEEDSEDKDKEGDEEETDGTDHSYILTPIVLNLFKKSVRICLHQRDVGAFVRQVKHLSTKLHMVVNCSVRSQNLEDTFLFIDRLNYIQQSFDIATENEEDVDVQTIFIHANDEFVIGSDSSKVRKELDIIRNKFAESSMQITSPSTDKNKDNSLSSINPSRMLFWIRIRALVTKHISSTLIPFSVTVVGALIALVFLHSIFQAGDNLNQVMQMASDATSLSRSTSKCLSSCRDRFNDVHDDDNASNYDDATILMMCVEARYDGWSALVDNCNTFFMYFPVSVDMRDQLANSQSSFFTYDHNDYQRVWWNNMSHGVLQILEPDNSVIDEDNSVHINDIGNFYSTQNPPFGISSNRVWTLNAYGEYYSDSHYQTKLDAIRTIYEQNPELVDPHCALGNGIVSTDSHYFSSDGLMTFFSAGYYWQMSQSSRQYTAQCYMQCYYELIDLGLTDDEMQILFDECADALIVPYEREHGDELAFQRFEYIVQNTLPSCNFRSSYHDKCQSGESITVSEFHEDILYSQSTERPVGLMKYSDFQDYDSYNDVSQIFPVAGLELKEYFYYLPLDVDSIESGDLEYSLKFTLHTYLPHYLVRRYTRLQTSMNVYFDSPYNSGYLNMVGTYSDDPFYPPVFHPEKTTFWFELDTDIAQLFPFLFNTLTDLTARLVSTHISELLHLRTYLQYIDAISFPLSRSSSLQCGKRVLFGSEANYDAYVQNADGDYSESYLYDVPACSKLPIELSPASVTIEGDARRLPEKLRSGRYFINIGLIFLSLIFSFFVVIVSVVLLMDIATNTNKKFLKLHGISSSVISLSNIIFIFIICLVFSLILAVILPTLINSFDFTPAVSAELNLANAIKDLENAQTGTDSLSYVVQTFETFFDSSSYHSMKVSYDMKFWNRVQLWLSSFLVIFLALLAFHACGMFLSAIFPSEEHFMSLYIFVYVIGILLCAVWTATYKCYDSVEGGAFAFFFIFPPFTLSVIFSILYDLMTSGFYPFSHDGAKSLCLRKLGRCISFLQGISVLVLQIIFYLLFYFFFNFLFDYIQQNSCKRKSDANTSSEESEMQTLKKIRTLSRSLSTSSVQKDLSEHALTTQPSSSSHISVSNVHVVYPNGTHAVRGVNMEIMEGEIVALCARNGGGKSSLIGTFTGQTPLTSGTIQIGHHDVQGCSAIIAGKVAVTPQQDVYWPTLSTIDHIYFFSLLHGVRLTQDEAMIILKSVGLATSCDKPAKQLSGGMKRRLTLACSLSTIPSIVLADEPCSGLDPATRTSILSVLEVAAGSSCVLLSTHSLGDAEDLCDHIVLMSHGTVVKQGGSSEMKEEMGGGYIMELSATKESSPEEKGTRSIISTSPMIRNFNMLSQKLLELGWTLAPYCENEFTLNITGAKRDEKKAVVSPSCFSIVLHIESLDSMLIVLSHAMECDMCIVVKEINLEDVMEHVETVANS